MTLTVVIGGTRSGKSAHAERLALATGLPVRYVATADAEDPTMADRIAAHVARRPTEWRVVLAGDDLAAAFTGAGGECVLLDGLGAWIAHRLKDAPVLPDRLRAGLVAARGAGAVIVVAEQAGEGVLPTSAVARRWLDLLGELTQIVSAEADRVDLVVAGKPLTISGRGDLPSQDASLRHHGDRNVRPGDADHAVNVISGGPPEWLRPALLAALEQDAGRYPDERPAAAAVAARHGRAPANVVPTNGAAEALWLIPPGLRPSLVAAVHPLFGEAEAALHAHGVAVRRVVRDPGEDFALQPDSVPEDADLVIVANPASPSGTLLPATAVLALRRPGRIVVVDEAFMDLVPGEPGSLAAEPLDDVIVVRSATKALSIPGLRAGYALAGVALAERLRSVRPPWSANVLALAALSAAAPRAAERAAIAERAAAERADLVDRLSAVDGLRVWPGSANFVLVGVPDGPAVAAALRDRAIAIREAASFPGLGPGHLRLTARDPGANARLADALHEVLVT